MQLLIFFVVMCSIKLVNSQFGQCDYEKTMESGESVSIFNPKYPKPDLVETHCRWTAKSDRPLQIKCDLRIPSNHRCSTDYLLIESASRAGERYCGYQNFTIISKNNPLVVSLHTSNSSMKGTFLCTLQITNKVEKKCNCGWKNPSRIVGGEDTGINEFPMMAGLVDIEKVIIFCGATIINNKQVLTAAHCLRNRSPTSLMVIVGEHDVSTGTDTDAANLFELEGYIMHPQYGSRDYDIALVTIKGSFEFNARVGPACLPFQHWRDLFAHEIVELLGWGNLQYNGAKPNILQKVDVDIIRHVKCSQYFPNIGPRQICHYRKDKDACQYDSGGPVLWHNPETNRLVIIGVISYGGTCADEKPGVNSRVGAFMKWILSHSPPEFKYCTDE